MREAFVVVLPQTANGRCRPGTRAQRPSTGIAVASATRLRGWRRCTSDAGKVAGAVCSKRSFDNQWVRIIVLFHVVTSCKLSSKRRQTRYAMAGFFRAFF